MNGFWVVFNCRQILPIDINIQKSKRAGWRNNLSEVTILYGSQGGAILRKAFSENMPLVMSYLSGRRWKLANVQITKFEEKEFEIRISPRKKSLNIELQAGQTVGMSLKHGYSSCCDKYVFDTVILNAEHSHSESTAWQKFSLAMPGQIELIQRGSYFRVKVPNSLEVNMQIRLRNSSAKRPQNAQGHEDCFPGRLLDISADGMQVAIDLQHEKNFSRGETIGIRFTPLSHETALMVNAQIRSLWHAADDKSLYFGLQLVGLEASPEGRLVLSRLVSIVEQYERMNQTHQHKPQEVITSRVSSCSFP